MFAGIYRNSLINIEKIFRRITEFYNGDDNMF